MDSESAALSSEQIARGSDMAGRELLGNPSRFRWRDFTHCVGERLIRVSTISAWVCDCPLTNVIRNRYEKNLDTVLGSTATARLHASKRRPKVLYNVRRLGETAWLLDRIKEAT